jgi:hypothetical protein
MRYVHHITHLKNQIKNQPNQTKPNQVRTITTTTTTMSLTTTIINNLGSRGKWQRCPRISDLLKLVGTVHRVVIGELMKEEMLTIKPQGKSKQTKGLFVCLFVCFVCAVEGRLHLWNNCIHPSSLLPTQQQLPLKSKVLRRIVKVKCPQSSASQQERGHQPVMAGYHSFEITFGLGFFWKSKSPIEETPKGIKELLVLVFFFLNDFFFPSQNPSTIDGLHK